MPGASAGMRQPTARHDLRTYFIALATNAYATMHYDITN
jgi:hypothetical protein